MRRTAVVSVVCIALLAVSVLACGKADPPPSIVIVVVDTLRADHLGLYGYESHPTSPHLDARAATAAVFERAHSTAPWTLPAFGSLLTGQLPARHAAGLRIVDVRDHPVSSVRPVAAAGGGFLQLDAGLPTLATRLGAAGYDTAAIVSNAFLSPEFGLQRGFDTWDYDPADPERRAAAVTDRALQWLAARPDPARPFLLLVHYFDPHMPYAAPEPFLGRFAAAYADERFGVPVRDMPRLRYRIRDRVDGWERYKALEQALYDEEIAYADEQIERLLADLDRRNFLEDGYLLLTSDHGEEFHEHGWVEHGHSVYEEVIRVPMLWWGPGVRAGLHALPVSLVDVFPTLLELAGVELDADVEGASLHTVLREGPADRRGSSVRFDRALLAENILYGDEKKALIRWPYKLLVDLGDDAQLLYDLERDPAELRGRGPDELEAATLDRLRAMLAEVHEKQLAAGVHGGEGAVLSEETLQRLRALGYIR